MARLWKIFLVLTLLSIPVIIYLFLQLFGANYYAAPVYYEQGVGDTLNCEFPPGQHRITALTAQTFTGDPIEINLTGQYTVIAFLKANCEDTCLQKFNQLSRIQGVFAEEPQVRILTIIPESGSGDDSDFEQPGRENTGDLWRFVELAPGQMEEFITCGLVMTYRPQSLHTMTLIDREGRIRGYYDGLDLEETDRLVLETKILLYEKDQLENEEKIN